MKKLFICLFALLLLLTLGSCKKEESSVSLSNEDTQKIQEVVEEKEEVVEETKQEEVFKEVKDETKTDKKEEIEGFTLESGTRQIQRCIRAIHEGVIK